MLRILTTTSVVAFACLMTSGAIVKAQPTPSDVEIREARSAGNPGEAQARAAAEHSRVGDAAERAMRIERARRIAPIDLWFGIR